MSKPSTTKKSTAKRKSVKKDSRQARDALTGKFLTGSAPLVRNRHSHKKMAAEHPARTEKGNPSRDIWSAFDALDDGDIERAVAEDADAAPVGNDAFWARATVVMPVPKQAISIRLDEDVLAFFKNTGPGYQSRINAVLRSYIEAKK